MNAVKPHFAIDHMGIGICQLHLPRAHTLHFASEQHNAGLDHINNGVVVPCLAITGNHSVEVLPFALLVLCVHIVRFSIRVA